MKIKGALALALVQSFHESAYEAHVMGHEFEAITGTYEIDESSFDSMVHRLNLDFFLKSRKAANVSLSINMGGVLQCVTAVATREIRLAFDDASGRESVTHFLVFYTR